MRKTVLFLLIITVFLSCSSEKDKLSENYSLAFETDEAIPITRQMNETPNAPMASSGYSERSTVIEKKIIKDANIGVEVSDYKIFRIKLDSMVRSFNGYISNDNLYNNDESINCDVVIRIPEKNFDKFLTNLEKGGAKTLYKNVSTRDVTEEFIDIEARLKNKKSVEKRYAQLLNKARTVKDILEIEEKLRVFAKR